ncbi:hypothetical protein [Sorangium cellulosum]|nr:hypothetical protein [Sorangium cellulosum]
MAPRTKASRGGAPPRAGGMDEDDEVDDLYKKPLGDFTRARDELAKRLRQAGDKDAADRVKALRRPTAAAWTLNQLARRVPQRMEALLDAGERLREAQAGALSPGGAQGLRDASQKHRAIVNELLRAAPALFAEGGYRDKGNSMDQVRDSLLATPTARASDLELLARGRLSQELEPGDLSDMLGLLRGRPSEKPAGAEVDADRGRKASKAGTPAQKKEKERETGKPAQKQKTTAEERERKEQRARKEREREEQRTAKEREREEQRTAKEREREEQRAEKEREEQRTAKQREREEQRAAKEREREERRSAKEQAEQRAAKERERKAQIAAEKRTRKERLAAEQREQKAQLAAAEKARDQASRDAAQAAKEAERLTKEAARMSRAADKAEEAARAARKRADEAERRAAEAQQNAASCADRLEAAEQKLDEIGR